MRLQINGQLMPLQEGLESQFWSFLSAQGVEQTEKLKANHGVLYTLVKTGIREGLRYFEGQFKKKGAPLEVIQKFWVPKGVNPINHSQQIIQEMLEKGSMYATLVINTDSTGIVTDFRLQFQDTGQAGGSLDTDGNEWIGEDHRAEVPGRDLLEVVSS